MNDRAGLRLASLPVLFQAPHRILFLAGATQILLALGWWAILLAERAGILPFAWVAGLHGPPGWPASWTHGALMIYGVFPLFMAGFLMTAMPRWQNAPPVAAGAYLAAATLQIAGWLLFYLGLAVAAVLPLAWLLILAGWLVAAVVLARVARNPHPDRRHARLCVLALAFGTLGVAAIAVYTWGGPAWLVPFALAIGIWGCLAPIFAVVSHRMIPFFSSVVIPKYEVVRPYWALYVLLGAFLAHGALQLADAQRWLWLADLPAAAVALALTRAWKLRRSFDVRLLAMLHIGFCWLWVAMGLSAAQSLAALLGFAALGFAPLHALSIGYFSATLLGMASRVTLGHSGRDLAADRATWLVFLALQAVAVVRIAAEFGGTASAHLLLASALGWLGCFAVWYRRYAPMYWRARSDGRPG